jgi:hypothetical protein
MNSRKTNTPASGKILGRIPLPLVRGFSLEKSDGLRLLGAEHREW